MLKCIDCGNECVKRTGIRFCSDCGGVLHNAPSSVNVPVNAAPTPTVFEFVANPNGTSPQMVFRNDASVNMDVLTDMFGPEFVQLLETQIRGKQIVISASYLEQLSKIKLNEMNDNENIFIDINVLLNVPIIEKKVKTLKALKFSSVLANFSAVPLDSSIKGSMILCDPYCKPVYDLNPATASIDKSYVFIVPRGQITFAQKLLALQAYLARGLRITALIIIQCYDTWPFIMADTAGELKSKSTSLNASALDNILSIPMIMINKQDGDILEQYCHANHKSEGKSSMAADELDMNVVIQVGSKLMECSICQDEMIHSKSSGHAVSTAGEVEPIEIYKLPCNHCYHVACVTQWLKMHHTCPMCRYECPAEVPISSATTTSVMDTSMYG